VLWIALLSTRRLRSDLSARAVSRIYCCTSLLASSTPNSGSRRLGTGVRPRHAATVTRRSSRHRRLSRARSNAHVATGGGLRLARCCQMRDRARGHLDLRLGSPNPRGESTQPTPRCSRRPQPNPRPHDQDAGARGSQRRRWAGPWEQLRCRSWNGGWVSSGRLAHALEVLAVDRAQELHASAELSMNGTGVEHIYALASLAV